MNLFLLVMSLVTFVAVDACKVPKLLCQCVRRAYVRMLIACDDIGRIVMMQGRVANPLINKGSALKICVSCSRSTINNCQLNNRTAVEQPRTGWNRHDKSSGSGS
mmetsp:Transcript_14694/g.21684  ORF Transcript_14694/g.21684 Transcript_14694/m.21684 type:complete len:105 (-) Transcript_14694:20-334(-)